MNRQITSILASILSWTVAKSKQVKYDVLAPIEDVRGGTILKVTYPPNVIDTL